MARMVDCPAQARQVERTLRERVFYPNTQPAKKMITKTIPDRSKIVIEREDHVKYWTRHLGVTEDELARAIERVGNSAAAVRKQLGALKTPTT